MKKGHPVGLGCPFGLVPCYSLELLYNSNSNSNNTNNNRGGDYMIEKCPNCGSTINYSYGYSYYLRCKRSYSCWHMSCDEATAKKYPEYINPTEEQLANDMRDKLLDNECDYFSEDTNE